MSLRAQTASHHSRRVVYHDDLVQALYSDTVRDGELVQYRAGFAFAVVAAGPLVLHGIDRDIHDSPRLPLSVDSIFRRGDVRLDTNPPQTGLSGLAVSAGGAGLSLLRLDSVWMRRTATATIRPSETAHDLAVRFVFTDTQLEASEPEESWRLSESHTYGRRVFHLATELYSSVLTWRLVIPYGETVSPAVRMQAGVRFRGSRMSLGLAGLVHTPRYINASGHRATDAASALVNAGLNLGNAFSASFAGRSRILQAGILPQAFRETEQHGRFRAELRHAAFRLSGEVDAERSTDTSGDEHTAVASTVGLGYSHPVGGLSASATRAEDHLDLEAAINFEIAGVRAHGDFRVRYLDDDVQRRSRYTVSIDRESGVLRGSFGLEDGELSPVTLSWSYAGPIPIRR